MSPAEAGAEVALTAVYAVVLPRDVTSKVGTLDQCFPKLMVLFYLL